MNPTVILFALLTGLGLGVAAGALVFSITFEQANRPVDRPRERPARFDQYLARQRQLLAEAGLGQLDLWTYLIGRYVVGFIVFAIAAIFLGPLVGIAAGVAGRMGVSGYVGFMRGERKKVIREAVLVFTRNLLNLLRSGAQPIDALTQLAGRSGPMELRTAMRELAQDMRQMDMAEAMRLAKDKVNDPLFDILAASMIVVSSYGTPMRDLLETVLEQMEARDNLIRRATSAQRQQKTSAVIVPGAFIVFGFGAQIFMGRGGYFAPYATIPGQVAELIALGCFVLGYVLMRALQRLPEIPRLNLRRHDQ